MLTISARAWTQDYSVFKVLTPAQVPLAVSGSFLMRLCKPLAADADSFCAPLHIQTLPLMGFCLMS